MPPLAQVGGMVDVVVLVDVVAVVVVAGSAGAQSSLGLRGVTERLPNWSFSSKGGNVPFGHLIL
jgi:hypothetical protein